MYHRLPSKPSPTRSGGAHKCRQTQASPCPKDGLFPPQQEARLYLKQDLNGIFVRL